MYNNVLIDIMMRAGTGVKEAAGCRILINMHCIDDLYVIYLDIYYWYIQSIDDLIVIYLDIC